MDLKDLKCSLCEGTVDDVHVFRVYKQSPERCVCAFCLETIVAKTAPMVYERVINECEVVYHDQEKEDQFAILARIDALVTNAIRLATSLPEHVKSKVLDADYVGNDFIGKLIEQGQVMLTDLYKEDKTLLPTPKEIFEKLEESVVSQMQAKKVLSVAAYNHYKRPFLNPSVEVGKSNILLIGPTGCGKTYLVSKLAEILDVPMVVFDANTITSAGYSGADVEDMVKALFLRADRNIEQTERGIIVIDEIDKLAQPKGLYYNKKDASSRGAQEALLKVIEGTTVEINLGPRAQKNTIQIDTKNILFVCMGAFSDIPKIIGDRLIGANASFLGGTRQSLESDNHAYSQVSSEDLTEFGLIPELIGRLPVIVSLQELTEDDLIDIMSNTKHSLIDQYSAQLAFDDIALDIPKESQRIFAKYALERKIGARGLRSAFDTVLLDTMFEAPENDADKITIKPEDVKEKLNVTE